MNSILEINFNECNLKAKQNIKNNTILFDELENSLIA